MSQRRSRPAAANGHGATSTVRRDRTFRIGARLRELRRRRRVALTGLAQRAGLSPGYLSQVERDLAVPSTTALSRLSEVLDVPLSYFFEPSAERLPEHFVVRRRQRRTVIYPGSSVRSELLVPDLRGKLEAVYFSVRPHTKSPVYKHDGEDFGYVLKGRLRVTVGDDTFTLERGDSISYPSHLSHFWETLGTAVEALWVVTPPSW